MKYMKLGSKQDTFQTDGSSIRYVASNLATDIIVNVGEVKFYLHKFPLLSKSNRLQRLIMKTSEDISNEIYLHDIPGGSKAFEICAKFCYGMIVTLNAYNVVAARCAADYLEMTEHVEKGNLIYKIEAFLNSSVLCSWKDSIIVLQTTKSLLPWSEELKIIGRCINSIASKATIDPSKVNWSYTCNKKTAVLEIDGNRQSMHIVPKDWWIEDVCELDIDLYKRVMVAVKSKGRTSAELIGEALKTYAVRWLPDSYDALVSADYARRNRSLVETIIWLLPSDKGSGCSCRFLLKLLKVVILVGAGDLLKEELMNRISVQLHKASIKDLLIPTRFPGDTIYDVHLMKDLVSRCLLHYGSNCNHEIVGKCEDMTAKFILGHESLLGLGKLIDGYLAEIASDPNLPMSSFIDLSVLVPEAARRVHDGLYTAIDIYLMEHTDLTKAEKKKICSLMDARKLSTDACIHIAQNERLPLRVVVQVLYFEQLRITARSQTVSTNGILHESVQSTGNIEEDLERPVPPEHYKSLKKQIRSVKINEDEQRNNGKKSCTGNNKSRGGRLLTSSRSRRIFDKLWAGKGQGENNRSSETSGSSHSPPSSSRHRRYSVS